MNQHLGKRVLEKLGYHVVTANNGQEAIDKVTHSRFFCVFMDCQMPGMLRLFVGQLTMAHDDHVHSHGRLRSNHQNSRAGEQWYYQWANNHCRSYSQRQHGKRRKVQGCRDGPLPAEAFQNGRYVILSLNVISGAHTAFRFTNVARPDEGPHVTIAPTYLLVYLLSASFGI